MVAQRLSNRREFYDYWCTEGNEKFGVNTLNGEITCEVVAKELGYKHVSIEEAFAKRIVSN